MSNNTPWYMTSNDPSTTDKGSQERQETYLRSIAEGASEEADAATAHLRELESKGVQIPASVRMAMGYSQNARKAADKLNGN
ncbi:hypothetical protein ACFO9E_28750 [Streptomyces maoxianensis]|uniref:Uncharacterized protein n=1 Tax=Streptomyces maoxianensis TaxID=1459942 RepID=A0ABV9GCM6_9ACTN